MDFFGRLEPTSECPYPHNPLSKHAEDTTDISIMIKKEAVETCCGRNVKDMFQCNIDFKPMKT